MGKKEEKITKNKLLIIFLTTSHNILNINYFNQNSNFKHPSTANQTLKNSKKTEKKLSQ